MNIWCSLISITKKKNVEQLCKASVIPHLGDVLIYTFSVTMLGLFMRLFNRIGKIRRGRGRSRRKCIETKATESVVFSEHWEDFSRPSMRIKTEGEFWQRNLMSFSLFACSFYFWFSCSARLLPEVSTSAADGFPQLWFGVSR